MRLIEKLEPYQSSSTSIDGYCWEYRPNLEDVINKVNEIIDVVNDAETVRHGHWVTIKDDIFADKYKCSECGKEPLFTFYDFALTPYCPFCGAKMDEVEDEID